MSTPINLKWHSITYMILVLSLGFQLRGFPDRQTLASIFSWVTWYHKCATTRLLKETRTLAILFCMYSIPPCRHRYLCQYLYLLWQRVAFHQINLTPLSAVLSWRILCNHCTGSWKFWVVMMPTYNVINHDKVGIMMTFNFQYTVVEINSQRRHINFPITQS